MFIKQADILSGLDKTFIKKMMDNGTKSTFEEGASLFKLGDPADHFYILIKGHIQLSTGDQGHSVYTVSHGGEAFGWSSLVGSGAYTATAKCIKATIVMMFHRDKLQPLMESEPSNAFKFYKNLSLTLGNRLVQSYNLLSSFSSAESTTSYGTGQTQEVVEFI